MLAPKQLLVLALAGLLLAGPVLSYDDEYGDEDYDDEYGGGSPGSSTPTIKEHINGMVDLDRFTFDKVITKDRPTFVAFYDTSEDKESINLDLHMVLETAAEKVADHLKLLCAKMDLTDDDNVEFRARFGNRETPFYLFFKDGSEPQEHTMDVSDLDAGEALHKYLIAEAGAPMAIESFAPLLADFMKNEKTRESVMEKVQELIPGLSVSEANAGKWYLKTMKNILNKGQGYLEKEYARLSKLVTDGADSLQPAKIQEFKLRQGVIDVFSGGKLSEAAAEQEDSD